MHIHKEFTWWQRCASIHVPQCYLKHLLVNFGNHIAHDHHRNQYYILFCVIMCRHIFRHLGSCTDSCHENVHRFELLISVAHIINTGIFNSDMVFIVHSCTTVQTPWYFSLSSKDIDIISTNHEVQLYASRQGRVQPTHNTKCQRKHICLGC